MNIEQIKNTLREFQAENRQKFKNTQAEFKKAVSYIKKKVYIHSASQLVSTPQRFAGKLRVAFAAFVASVKFPFVNVQFLMCIELCLRLFV